jgi:hypothetical protein
VVPVDSPPEVVTNSVIVQNVTRSDNSTNGCSPFRKFSFVDSSLTLPRVFRVLRATIGERRGVSSSPQQDNLTPEHGVAHYDTHPVFHLV